MPPRFTRYACPLCGYAVSIRGKTVTVTHPGPKRSKRGSPQPVELLAAPLRRDDEGSG